MKPDLEDAADAMRELVKAALDLNAAVEQFQAATGISVQLYVDGHEYGSRVGVRIEGNLIDAYAEKEAPHD